MEDLGQQEDQKKSAVFQIHFNGIQYMGIGDEIICIVSPREAKAG